MVLFFVLTSIVLVVSVFARWCHLTNPFARSTIYRSPWTIRWAGGTLHLDQHKSVVAHTLYLWRLLAYVKAGFHIIANAYTGSPKARSTTADAIADEIIALRFDYKRYPYLISGDHFSMLYLRSLGIFYYPSLDPHTSSDESQWQAKQAMYLKTLAYALAYHAQDPHLYTTLVPAGKDAVTGIQIYSYPTDSLYSILLALYLTRDPLAYDFLYPPQMSHRGPEKLATIPLSHHLGQHYQDTIVSLLDDYLKHVLDPQTGRVRQTHFSGTKDITRKTAGFYDNVILWRTLQLAQELGYTPADPVRLQTLKADIIATYWDHERGYFIEDESPDARRDGYYSSDWLIVLSTRFLDPRDPGERIYYDRSIRHIIDHKLDEPFPLRYHAQDRASRQFPIVKLFLPEYGGSVIWSFWGMEYIKALILLGDPTSLDKARQYLQIYATNIEKTHGFPEVYDRHGVFLESLAYRSVRQTGWVVGYQQACRMLKAWETETGADKE